MRPCLQVPLHIRSVALGGREPLFCVPLVAERTDSLLEQARIAAEATGDLVEWRADSFEQISEQGLVHALGQLRRTVGEIPIIFSLRVKREGGARFVSQELRARCIDAVMRASFTDIVDLELSNGPEFLRPLLATAASHGVRVILSYHDFEATPSDEFLRTTIASMVAAGGDIAKVACMPREPGDVLRLMQATLAARKTFPSMPLCTIAMGALGSVSRVAGFLYGSDMTFAVGQSASAPGQIPLADARRLAGDLLRFAE